MAKFTKYNNPNRKRRPRRKPDYTERCIMAGKAMIDDQMRGTELPISAYEMAYGIFYDKNGEPRRGGEPK